MHHVNSTYLEPPSKAKSHNKHVKALSLQL